MPFDQMAIMLVYIILSVTLFVFDYGDAIAPTVTFDGTTFTGIDRANSRQFQGIKFAEAPRFQDPVPVLVSGLPAAYDATLAGPMCMQACPAVPAGSCQAGLPSEDCLFLNIFTPKNNHWNTDVVFFIHGGNFQAYSGASLLFDGDQFVKVGGVILVTINYRLGAFGFLGVRNVGIKDMIEALKWTQQHISNFGGSPHKITVMGQSAGSISIPLLLTIPEVQNIIHRVILQSPPLSLRYRTAAEAAIQESNLATSLGCAVGDQVCYDSKLAIEILTKQFDPLVYTYNAEYFATFQPWGPSIDGNYVKDHPLNLFVNRQFRNVDILIGDVENEGILFVATGQDDLTLDEIDVILDNIVPGLTYASLSKLYPLNQADPKLTLAEIATDFIFRCPARKVATTIWTRHKKAYKYTFNALFPFPLYGGTCDSYVCHGDDLVYAFNTASLAGLNLPQSHLELADTMIEYFTNFAKNGDTNRYTYFWWWTVAVHPHPKWFQSRPERYCATSTMVLELGTSKMYFHSSYREEFSKCSLFDRLDAYNP